MHGSEISIDRTWENAESYHCIYGSKYKYVQLKNWNVSDISSCLEYCGVLGGAACPEKVYVPKVFFFSLFLAFGTLWLRYLYLEHFTFLVFTVFFDAKCSFLEKEKFPKKKLRSFIMWSILKLWSIF